MPCAVKAFAVVGDFEFQPVPVHLKSYPSRSATGMLDDIVYGFLENQEDFAAQVGAEGDVVAGGRGIETERNAAGGEDVDGDTAQALDEIAKVGPLGVDCPDDVAHRVHQFVGYGDYAVQRLDTAVAVAGLDTPLGHLAEDRNLGQARSDIVVEVRGYAGSHALELSQSLFAASLQRSLGLFALLFSALSLGHVA